MKKILSLVVAVFMILTTMAVPTFAEETTVSVWDGTSYSIEWCEAEHTKDGSASGQTYYIESAEDLAGLAYLINTWYDKTGDSARDPYCSNNAFQGDTVILNTDIDLANFPWEPIGSRVHVSDKNAFRGNFDGNGHTIKNLYVPAEKYYYAGLFGKIATNNFSQTFSNIIIENATVSSLDEPANNKEGAGALFGDSYGSVIDNCHVTGTIAITSGDVYAGALCGQSRSQISNSTVTATGTVEAQNYYAGGLVGQLAYSNKDEYSTSIKNCSVTGTEEGFAVKCDTEYAGGLVGWVPSKSVENVVIDAVTVSDITVESANSISGVGAALVAQNFTTATNTVVKNTVTKVDDEVVTPTDSENVTYVVANVDGEDFTDLASAFKAVKENSVINILADVTIDTEWQCNFGRGFASGTFNNNEVIINGNNHIIKFTGKMTDGNTEGVISTGAPITVNDLTFDLSECPSYRRVISARTSAVIDNCTFIGNPENTKTTYAVIVGESGGDMLANTTLVVSDSDFNDFNYGISDNRNGEDIKALTIDGNEFNNASINVSASEEVTITDNVMDGGYVKVASYSQPNELAVTVKGNTLDEDFAADNSIQAGANMDVQDGFILPAATVNGVKYMTVQKAIDKASDGDVIYVAPGTYTESLNITKSVVITGNPNYGSVSLLSEIEKPVINIADVTNGGVQYYAENVVFDNIVFNVLENATGQTWNVSAIGYYYENTVKKDGLTVTNCDFINNSAISMSAIAANISNYTVKNNTFKNFTTIVHSFVDHGEAGNVEVANNTFENVENIINAYYGAPANGNAKIKVTNNTSKDGSTAKIILDDFGMTKVTPATAYNEVILENNDADLVLHNYGMNNFALTNVGNGDVVYTYRTEEIMNSLDGQLPEGTIYVDYGNDNEQMFIVEGNVAKDTAKTVEIVFEEDTTDPDALDNSVWNIVLKSADKEIINRLNSADLTFALDNANMAYEIVASNDEIEINPVNNSKDRYEFHFDGKDAVVTDTASSIVIGQVKFTGYGDFVFNVVASAPNAVHATEFNDNIVESYTGSALIVNRDEDAENDGVIESDIKVPTKNLTIDICFPNTVAKQRTAYQQMKVTVAGGDLDEDIVIDLGHADQDVDLTYDSKAGANYTVTVGDCYVIELTDVLTVNNSYTVTVEGAGYRTARYTVTMTEDKELNFWNNVMDEEQVVEVGKETSKTVKNFLAGDIVADSNINIYDLSAVVSYFGTTNDATAYSDYAKYDLNRDGLIDSKDVAYVLVSWGK